MASPDRGSRLTFLTTDNSGTIGTRQVAPARLEAATETAFFVVPAEAVTGSIDTTHVGALNFTNFPQWTVGDGAVDLIGNGFFDFIPGNGLYLDLGGSASNGGRLERYAKELVEAGIDSIAVSIDGPPEVHDRIRGQKGSFEAVAAGVRAVAKWRRELKRVLPMQLAILPVTELNIGDIAPAIDALRGLPIEIAAFPQELAVLSLARRHQLSFYDAAYLELAQRERIDLATFDRALVQAATAEGVQLVGV